jgi:hypothetical protein
MTKKKRKMRFAPFLIPLFLLCMAPSSCRSQTLSPENAQKIEALQSELEKVRSEIAAAEAKNASMAGGLLKALVEARTEILKTTESLIEQRIHALEAGAKITVNISGTEPNEALARQLQLEIESQVTELKHAKQEAARYSGGVMAAMKQATVATQEQTVTMLRQRYLAAKYGLPVIRIPGSAGTASEQQAVPASSSTSPPASLDVPAEVGAGLVAVKLLSKRFAEEDYQEFIWFNIEFTAEGLDKPLRAIKGVLNLQDLFGEPRMRLNWTLTKPVNPGEAVVERGMGFKYNQFLDSHQWVLATDIRDMTASFTVKNILYEDGSRRDF